MAQHVTATFECMFINQSREAGEQDLYNSVDTEDREACWLYMSTTQTWSNIAISATHVKVNGKYVKMSVQTKNPQGLFGRVTHYHTHPRIFFNDQLRRANENRQLTDREILSEMLNISLPSPEDIVCYEGWRRNNPDANLDFKIVHPFGITTTMMQHTAKRKLIGSYAEGREYLLAGTTFEYLDERVDFAAKFIKIISVNAINITYAPRHKNL